jgi:hypothetical protein
LDFVDCGVNPVARLLMAPGPRVSSAPGPRVSSPPARDPSSPARDPSTSHSAAPPTNGPATHLPTPATVHTIYGAAAASPRQAPSSSAPSSPSLVSSTSATQGQSKFQRWSGSASGSPEDGLPPRSWVGRPLFRDVLLLQRAPPAPAPSASSPREPSPLETGTSFPHHKERHRRFRGLERAPETTLGGGWTRVESRNSKKRHLRTLRARRPVPGDLAGRCFNCLAEDHLAASCRLGPRCFRCKALGHRSYVCSGPVNGDEIFPVHRRRLRGAVWSRLSTVAPTNVDRLATGPVPQHQLARASVWERLLPPAPRPCKKMRVSVWRRISPPGIEKGQAHFERMNGAVDARAFVTPSSDVGAAAVSVSQGSLPPRPRRKRQTPSKAQVIP